MLQGQGTITMTVLVNSLQDNNELLKHIGMQINNK